MTNDKIKMIILDIADEYSFKNVVLFGSRAVGTNNDDSDIDLIVEFNRPVTIMFLSNLKNKLEDLTGLSVDVIHGPIRDTDMIEVGKVVELYAA